MQKKEPHLIDTVLVAAEQGFEPRQTESESVVLPLHNSAIHYKVIVLTDEVYYITYTGKCQVQKRKK